MRTSIAVLFVAALAGGCDRPEKGLLARYTFQAGPIRIEGILDNASGVAYCPQTKTLFVVVNAPTAVYEIDLRGKVRRVIELNGFADTEGIAHVEGSTFAIADEGAGTVRLVQMGRDTTSVDSGDAVRVAVDPNPGGNRGLEGVAYDPRRRRLFAVKESDPRRVYCFDRPSGAGSAPAVTRPWDAEADSLGLSDLSGVHWHAPTGHLLVLSDESACLVECTAAGKEVSRLDLSGGSAGLKDRVPQAEGVTLDDRGNLYVVSEPNLLYVIVRR